MFVFDNVIVVNSHQIRRLIANLGESRYYEVEVLVRKILPGWITDAVTVRGEDQAVSVRVLPVLYLR